jgi:hypothetical protein
VINIDNEQYKDFLHYQFYWKWLLSNIIRYQVETDCKMQEYT